MSKPNTKGLRLAFASLLAAFLLVGCSTPEIPPNSPSPSAAQSISTPLFVALGDFGTGDSNQQAVASEIAKRNPEWFISLGDNVYSQAGYETLVGDFYSNFITESKFFPATGNHDYKEGISNFDSYFGKSEDTRFYKFSISQDIEFFVLDSQAALDSDKSMKSQRSWLKKQLFESAAKYRFVVLHHPPFSSGSQHGSNSEFQWDFSSLGVTAVLSGHEHLYERIQIDGVYYLVSGAGGRELYECGEPVTAKAICIDGVFGALYFSRLGEALVGQFRSTTGEVLDSFTLP